MVNLLDSKEVASFRSFPQYLRQLANDGVTPLIEKQLIMMLDQSLPFFGLFIPQIYFQSLFEYQLIKKYEAKTED